MEYKFISIMRFKCYVARATCTVIKEVLYYLDAKVKQALFKNKEDLQHLISGGYVRDNETSKRPLCKLIKDISSELELA